MVKAQGQTYRQTEQTQSNMPQIICSMLFNIYKCKASILVILNFLVNESMYSYKYTTHNNTCACLRVYVNIFNSILLFWNALICRCILFYRSLYSSFTTFNTHSGHVRYRKTVLFIHHNNLLQVVNFLMVFVFSAPVCFIFFLTEHFTIVQEAF